MSSEEKNLVAMVGHTFLFNSAVRYVKKLIDKGELGDIRYIYSQRVNLGRIRNDVDALWNLAPHDISIIHFLLGEHEFKKVKQCNISSYSILKEDPKLLLKTFTSSKTR